MAHVIVPPGWRLPERMAAPKELYLNRRDFLRRMSIGGASLGLAACSDRVATIAPSGGGPGHEMGGPGGTGCDANPPSDPLATICAPPNPDLYPASPNPNFVDPPGTLPYEGLTDRRLVASHNNFYEFIGNASSVHSVWGFTGPFRIWPWTVEIAGEAEVTGRFDLEELEREFGLEERVYRLRCVEAWSIVVPWTGYPLRKLMEKFRPLSSARYVRFTSFLRPDQAVGQRTQPWYPWPYYEALRMDEALNELAFVATGVYGGALPKQNGAPWRLALPWKYGFKSAKSIQRIEFVRERPSTLWADVWPEAYGFYSNVNPWVPHPEWSQEFEEVLGGPPRARTELFNGYGEYVADLYDPELLTYAS